MNIIFKYLLIMIVGALMCGYFLHNGVFSEYSKEQIKFELKIAEKAEKIRSGELQPSNEEVANLLLTLKSRDVENYAVKFYMYVSMISVAIGLFLYVLGFYMGRKNASSGSFKGV